MEDKGDKHRGGDAISKLIKVMAHLRSEEGCPWDREQTHNSLKPYLLEECGEFMDAIDDKDVAGMCEELGDLFLHVVFHASIAEENGAFSLDDVARGVTEKLLRRHPHVFGDMKAENSAEVLDIWQEEKKKEKHPGRESLVDGVPRNMPALSRAHKMQKQVAKVGFDWRRQEDIVAKIEEELAELKEAIAKGGQAEIDEEIGDMLFSLVNLQRHRDGDTAEELLGAAIRKFERRFRHIEAKAGRDLRGCSTEEMENWWEDAKRNGL